MDGMKQEMINLKAFHLFLSVLLIPWGVVSAQPLFVWKDAQGSGRQEKILFRRVVEIDEVVTKAELCLFGDSRYHLYVNGIHLAFGPTRFYPENPQYDRFDLRPYLKSGVNTIAVEVLSNGTETYQIPKSQGGFIAWGEIVSGDTVDILETPGKWKYLETNGFDEQAVRFSFACGPMEIYDARNEPEGWVLPTYDDRSWQAPMVIDGQSHWGRMTERGIPFLTMDEYSVKEIIGVYHLQQKDDLYHWSIKTPDETNSLYHSTTKHPFLAYTYVYSPIDQDVKMGGFWGKYFVNGEEPFRQEPNLSNPVREDRWFKFKTGWNELVILGEGIWGMWDNYFSFPRSAKLQLSPNQEFGDKRFLKVNALVGDDQREEIAAALKKAKKLSEIPDKIIDLCKAVSMEPIGRNPARDISWLQADVSGNCKSDDYSTSVEGITEPTLITADLGRKSLGAVFLDVEAPEGAVIDVGWSEDLNPQNGMPYLYKRDMINSACRFIADGIRTRYQTFKPYGVRYLVLLVRSSNGPVTVKKMGVVEQVYPYEKKGRFECSNPMLNEIWELGWRTLRVCSEDSYVDTPFRERGLYAGDALPEYAITLVTSGDSRLMKKSLLLFQDMYNESLEFGVPTKHNDFILKTLIALYWYCQMTNDLDLLRSVYPGYKRYLDSLEASKDPAGYYVSGLGSGQSRKVFLEWTKIDKQADLCAYQSILFGCFEMMSTLAHRLGIESDVEDFENRADHLKTVINQAFWDESKNIYFDGYLNGEKVNSHFMISSSMPLLFGIPDSGKTGHLLDFLDKESRDIGEISRNRKTTPYSSFYLLAAWYLNERSDLAERFIIQYWSRMIHQGNDTSWENFDIDFGNQGTASHAWSGHPTFFLSTEVLGVKLGFWDDLNSNRIRVEPQSATLNWARGTVPHPLGEVRVDWKIQGSLLLMKVDGPEGVELQIRPKGRLAEYELKLLD